MGAEFLRFWHGRPIFLTKTQKKATKQGKKQCKEEIKSKWKAKSETKEGQVSTREVSLQFKKERSILEAQKEKNRGKKTKKLKSASNSPVA